MLTPTARSRRQISSRMFEPLEERTLMSGGTGGGGTGGGGGGGGTVTPAPAAVVAYSNFGSTTPANGIVGYAEVGVLPTGGFDYTAEQFSPSVSGALSNIRIPIRQYDTGGNGQFSLLILSDSAAAPNTLGTVLGTYRGQALRTGATGSDISSIAVSNGPKLVAGQQYWIEVQPSAQSREAWDLNPINATGLHYYTDPFSTVYTPDQVQGAFEISVTPAATVAAASTTTTASTFSTTPITSPATSFLASSQPVLA